MDDLVLGFAKELPDASASDLFAALHRICDAHVGTRLFTCSRFDLAAGQAERIFTSDPAAYPLTGLKEIVPNRWTEIVLDRKEPFLAPDIEGLRDVFPDHEKIEALGLGAAINLPVFVGGRLLGTANLLDANHRYGPATLEKLAPVLACAAMAFMAFLIEREAPQGAAS